ncbi:MAG: GGDEF domain-containing protein [Hungatella sp.]
MKKNKPRFFYRILILTGIFLCCFGKLSAWAAMADAEGALNPKVIRVGWYDYAGFYMTDENGYRSGYGYDYLLEMARFGGWSYEYVEGTVSECFQMLEDGKIDLMGSVMYSPERAMIMDFSTISMGKNFTVMTVRSDDSRYQIGNPRGFDGIKVGALQGDTRQNELESYSKKQRFTYQLEEYATPDLIERALQNREVDALLGTNMRVAGGQERIIAQYAPRDFYFVTKKGNARIKKSIDAAMEQIEFNRKDFQSELSKKYFSVDMSGSLTFTEEELQFLQTQSQIRVLLPSLRRPMAYQEDGVYKGILVDILNALGDRIGVSFEYMEVRDQIEGITYADSGQADILANVYNDCGWAERNHLFLSRPYMTLDYVSVSQIDSDVSKPNLRIAAVKGYRFSQDFVQKRYDENQITWYDNEEACINAVQKGSEDICFVSTYVANDYLQNYRYRNLYSSIISYSHGITVGVSSTLPQFQVLLSILDKGIASMGDLGINNIINANTMPQSHHLSAWELIMRNPVPFVGVCAVFSMIIIVLASMLLSSRKIRRKDQELYRAKLAAERDSLTGLYNRLSFELLVSEVLSSHASHKMSAFAMLDIDDFKQINDRNGHSYGDKILVMLAQNLDMQLKPETAFLCRMGGDEFALFLPEISAEEQILRKLQQVHKQVGSGCDDTMPIPFSMGIAFTSEYQNTFAQLYEAADTALYCAKQKGKNLVCVAESSTELKKN